MNCGDIRQIFITQAIGSPYSLRVADRLAFARHMKSRLPFALALALPVSLVLQPTIWVNTVLAIDILTEGSLGLSKTTAYTRYVRLQVELWRPPREPTPLPEVDISNATPKGLHALTHGWTRPAVVRNALKDTPAVQAWSDPEWWREHYGNESVNVVHNGDGSRSYLDLNSAFDQLPTHYISFSTSLMARFTQLREMMSCNEAVRLVEAGFGKFWLPTQRAVRGCTLNPPVVPVVDEAFALSSSLASRATAACCTMPATSTSSANLPAASAGRWHSPQRRPTWAPPWPSAGCRPLWEARSLASGGSGYAGTRWYLSLGTCSSTRRGHGTRRRHWAEVSAAAQILYATLSLSRPHATACAAGDLDVGVASRYMTGDELSGLFFDKYPHTAGSGGLQTYPFASFLLAFATAREFVRMATPYEAVKQLFFGAKAGVSPMSLKMSAIFKDNTTADLYGGGTHNQHHSSGLPMGWAGALEEKLSGYTSR